MKLYIVCCLLMGNVLYQDPDPTNVARWIVVNKLEDDSVYDETVGAIVDGMIGLTTEYGDEYREVLELS